MFLKSCLITALVMVLALGASCGGGSSSGSGGAPASSSSGSGSASTMSTSGSGSASTSGTAAASLGRDESAETQTVFNSVLKAAAGQTASSLGSRKEPSNSSHPVAQTLNVQGRYECPNGGAWFGGGSVTTTPSGDGSLSVSGLFSETSTECVYNKGQNNVSGIVMLLISGECPGEIKITETGNVTVYRKGPILWVPADAQYGVLQNTSFG